jgi:hypothetical protein
MSLHPRMASEGSRQRIASNAGLAASLTVVLGAILVPYWRDLASAPWGRPPFAPELLQWQIADWLISFEGGPLRRGLLGTVNLHMADLLGWPPAFVVAIEQSTLYGVLFFCVWRLCRDRVSGVQAAVLASPLFLLFVPNTPPGGFRKEIIFFGIIAVACVMTQARRRISSATASVLGTAYCLGCFAHEMLGLLFPWLAGQFWLQATRGLLPRRHALGIGIACGFGAAAGVVFASFFPGNTEIQGRLCDGLVGRGFDPSICGGAVLWVGQDRVSALSTVRTALLTSGEAWRYLAASLIALIPVSIYGRLLTKSVVRNDLLVVVVVFGTSIVSILPLFVLAIDWGRWIHVEVSCLSLTLLSIAPASGSHPASRSALSTPARAVATAFLATSLFWGVSDCGKAFKEGVGVRVTKMILQRIRAM